MWSSKKLTLSPDAAGVVCSVLAVNPWTPGAGKQESSGVYLSPENAIEWAAKKLAGAPSNLDVTAILFTAPTLSAFITRLDAAAAAFPLSAITQVQRRARSALSLMESRMQLPVAANGLPAAGPLSVSSLRKAASAAAMVESAGGVGSDISGALQAFKAARASALKDAREVLEIIAGASLQVSAVSSQKNTAGAVKDMREGIPNPDHVFSLCVVFAGADLGALRGMLKDVD
ncbi:hypothetical protein [Lelliottia nimipressuralis]|uniref:hypothetical protein n=1 Tax=Lelliottia nimipressuralis TaxID=69220 RepID=UPI00289EEEAA|nr:hypothetical protein [Lelliottia nimipressuralis]